MAWRKSVAWGKVLPPRWFCQVLPHRLWCQSGRRATAKWWRAYISVRVMVWDMPGFSLSFGMVSRARSLGYFSPPHFIHG